MPRVTIDLDDETAALLADLAGSAEGQGPYLARLIHTAAAAEQGAPAVPEVVWLRVQVLGLISEIQQINARLVSLETREE